MGKWVSVCVLLVGALFGLVLKGNQKQANHLGLPYFEDDAQWGQLGKEYGPTSSAYIYIYICLGCSRVSGKRVSL